MKLLLFSDLHCDKAAARHLVELSSQVDCLIGAGDFGTCRRRVGDTIGVLQEITLPAVLVPGNSESAEELRAACAAWPTAHVLHGSGVMIQGIDFFGIGGGIPVTPFGEWSYDFTEEEARQLLSSCPSNAVLVSHSPPHGAVDMSSQGVRLGSRAIYECTQQTNPRLVVCGHIHESAGQMEKVGDTPIVNAGPAGIVWTI